MITEAYCGYNCGLSAISWLCWKNPDMSSKTRLKYYLTIWIADVKRISLPIRCLITLEEVTENRYSDPEIFKIFTWDYCKLIELQFCSYDEQSRALVSLLTDTYINDESGNASRLLFSCSITKPTFILNYYDWWTISISNTKNIIYRTKVILVKWTRNIA